MIKILKLIRNEFSSLDIPYYFENWDDELELPYVVGELSEVPNDNECGLSEYSLTLTCEDVNSYSKLLQINEKIKNEYKHNKKITLDNSAIVIGYENMITVPVEAEDIKRIQINLNIKLWEDN